MVIYFDNNSTTKIDQRVLEKMNLYYNEPYNPSSIHQIGKEALRIEQMTKEKILTLLRLEVSHDIIFTSSGTEANNLAILSFIDRYKIFTSKIEHSSIYKLLENRDNVEFLPVSECGIVDIREIGDDLISIMNSNNETGVIQPKIPKNNNIIHSDFVQSIGKMQLSDISNIDLISVASHKIYGPSGIGALIYNKNLDLKPMIIGGGQFGGVRAGTYSIPLIVGFAEAFELSFTELEGNIKHLEGLRNYLDHEIIRMGGIIICKDSPRLCNTSMIAMRGINKDAQLIYFDMKGIAVSAGSACNAGIVQESRVLNAMGISKEIANSSIRVSLGKYNTKKEVEIFLSFWEKLYKKSVI